MLSWPLRIEQPYARASAILINELEDLNGFVAPSAYDRTREEIAKAIAMLLAHKQLSVQDQDIVETALEKFRKHKGVSFSDILIFEISRKNGHVPLGSFDREFAKLEGVQRL